MNQLQLGFIGFGEAAQRFALDFAQAGVTGIVAYSPSVAAAGPDHPAQQRAAAAGVRLVRHPREVCRDANLVISLTPGSAALSALRKVRRYLRPEQIYVDASTAAVKSMEQAAAMLEGRARFVDAAIMDIVPLVGIRAMTFASGPAAPDFQALVAPYGMTVEVVGSNAGAASAMKLIRSVCMKGLAGLLLESMEAAHRYGVLEPLSAHIAQFMNDRPFEQIMKRFVCGTAVHAERRVHEMNDSLALLKSLGVPSEMTRATRAKLKSVARTGLREEFGGEEPGHMLEVLEALIDADR